MFEFLKKQPKERLIVRSKKKQEAPRSFFDLSVTDQKKIIKEAAQRANEDQQKLVDKYDKTHNYCI